MVGTDTLDTVKFHFNRLTGTKLGDQDVRVDGLNCVIASKELFLATDGVECDIFGVDVRILVEFAGVSLLGIRVGVLGTFDVQAQDDGVVIGGTAAIGIVVGRLLEPAHPVDALHGTLEGNQTQTLCENLILNDRGVVVDEDVFDGDAGHLSHENATEGIGNGGVDSDEREGGFESLVAVEVDLEILFAKKKDV